MRYARMRDKNEPEIIRALRAAGARVTSLNGTGVPDLLVGYKGAMFLLEVKPELGVKGGKGHVGGASNKSNGGDGVLTEAQVKWWKEWTGPAPIVVRTAHDALEVLRKRDIETPDF